MKKIFAVFALLFVTLTTALAQEADKIVGTYLTEKKNAKVRISKQGEKYIGSIIWSITEGPRIRTTPRRASARNPS